MLTVLEAAEAVHGRHIGDNPVIESVSSDSRTIETGALFVALRGERFDGHRYVEEAVNKGAVGAMVDAESILPIPQIIVDDTEYALGQLAAGWRRRFDIPLVAITGSNGKTTVKEMIGKILTASDDTLISQGNYNNLVGLPLSLLKLRESHRFAAVEIGMNQVGEIERLASIAQPDVAVITNAGAAHLEFLVSVDQVATEKGRIIASLSDSGVAVLNADSSHYSAWCRTAGLRKVISFGFSSAADVSGTYATLTFGSQICMKTPLGEFQVDLQLAGEHNVMNALAAAAAAVALGLAPSSIKAGLENMSVVAGRLQPRKHLKGGCLIDDTYNANPNSVAAALAFISKLNGDRRLVIGDMFELGAKGEELHRDVGRLARECGIGRLYALGTLSAAAAEAFGRGATHYSDREMLINDLGSQLDETTTVLIKGSRGMKMDEIADSISMPANQYVEEVAEC